MEKVPPLSPALSWTPQPERPGWILWSGALLAAALIGLASPSPSAFLLPFALIAVLVVKLTWYRTPYAVAAIVACVMFTRTTRFQDPWIFLCALMTAMQIVLYGRRPSKHPLHFLIFFYFTWTIVGLAVGANLAENVDYLITFIGLMLYYAMVSEHLSEAKWVRWVPRLLALGFAPIGLGYIYLFATGQLGEYMTTSEVLEGFLKAKHVQLKSTLVFLAEFMGERNFLAMHLCFVLPITIYAHWGAKEKFWKKLLLLFALCHMAAILFCGSRAGVAGLGLVLMMLFLYERRRREVWIVFGVGILAIALLFPKVMAERFKGTEAMSQEEDYSKFTRKELLKGGLKMARDHIFVGVGPRNFAWAFQEYYWKPIYIPQAFRNLEAHNTYVQLLAEGGIFIFLLFLAIFGLTFWNFHRAEHYWKHTKEELSLIMRGAKLGWLGWLFCLIFLSGTADRLLWVVIGFSVASYLAAKQDRSLWKEKGSSR